MVKDEEEVNEKISKSILEWLAITCATPYIANLLDNQVCLPDQIYSQEDICIVEFHSWGLSLEVYDESLPDKPWTAYALQVFYLKELLFEYEIDISEEVRGIAKDYQSGDPLPELEDIIVRPIHRDLRRHANRLRKNKNLLSSHMSFLTANLPEILYIELCEEFPQAFSYYSKENLWASYSAANDTITLAIYKDVDNQEYLVVYMDSVNPRVEICYPVEMEGNAEEYHALRLDAQRKIYELVIEFVKKHKARLGMETTLNYEIADIRETLFQRFLQRINVPHEDAMALLGDS